MGTFDLDQYYGLALNRHKTFDEAYPIIHGKPIWNAKTRDGPVNEEDVAGRCTLTELDILCYHSFLGRRLVKHVSIDFTSFYCMLLDMDELMMTGSLEKNAGMEGREGGMLTMGLTTTMDRLPFEVRHQSREFL
jgi:hypothetical protein